MTAHPFVLALAIAAQAGSVPDPVRWSLAPPKGAGVPAGAVVNVRLAADIQPGWHVYSTSQPEGGPIATEISLPPGQPFTFARPIRAPKPYAILDPNFDMRVELYTEKAEFTLPIKVGAGTSAGAHMLAVEVRYQSCNDTICLPPRAAKLTLALAIRGQ